MAKTKVVYNACFGGFSLSKAAVLRARELGARWALPDTKGGDCNLVGEDYKDGSTPHDLRVDSYHLYNIARHDRLLVQIVEELGGDAGGAFADLKVAVVDGPYRVDEYDGNESIMRADDYNWIDPDG